jgi:hypothetical protein
MSSNSDGIEKDFYYNRGYRDGQIQGATMGEYEKSRGVENKKALRVSNLLYSFYNGGYDTEDKKQSYFKGYQDGYGDGYNDAYNKTPEK